MKLAVRARHRAPLTKSKRKQKEVKSMEDTKRFDDRDIDSMIFENEPYYVSER